MDTSVLRNKIHEIIDSSDEETLQSVYQLLQQTEYTDEFKNILNEELADYQKGKKVISKEDMDLLIQEVLNQ